MRRGTAEEKLMYAFDLYDTNKVGYLNRSQVEQVINNMLELLQEDKIQSKSKVCAQECIQLLAKSNHGRLYKKEFIQGEISIVEILPAIFRLPYLTKSRQKS